MLFNLLLSAAESGAEETANASFMDKYGMIIILGVFFVIMIVMTIIPNKKRQKQMQDMMSNLVVGAKIMTIGRMIGKVVSIDGETNQIILNVGTVDSPTYITIDRNAVGYVMDSPAKAAEVSTEETKTEETTSEESSSDDLKI